jgi:hypothetical protein
MARSTATCAEYTKTVTCCECVTKPTVTGHVLPKRAGALPAKYGMH